jgi:hypothetical protein
MRWKSEGDFEKVFAGYSLFTGRPSVRTLGKRSGSLNALSPIEKHNLS